MAKIIPDGLGEALQAFNKLYANLITFGIRGVSFDKDSFDIPFIRLKSPQDDALTIRLDIHISLKFWQVYINGLPSLEAVNRVSILDFPKDADDLSKFCAFLQTAFYACGE